MSVLQKLFHKRRNSKQPGIFNRKPRSTPSVIELPSKEVKGHDEPSVFVALPPPDVRLVLFQECGDTSDRRLLFDSKSFEPQKPDTPDNSALVMSNLQQGHVNNNAKTTQTSSKPCQYNYVRGPQDSEIVSEMLFGSVGMASRASSLKIHIMKNPHRLMLSRVFCVESAKESSSLERGLEPQRSAIPVLSRRKANTLPVPTPEPPYIPPPVPQSLATSLTSRLTRSDSSSSLISLGAQIFGASLGATGSLGSRPIPPQFSSTRAHSLPPATKQVSRDSFKLTTEPNHGVMARRIKVKIGFAVLFQPEPSKSSEFQQFFFEHFPLIESYLTLLKENVESALNNSRRSGRMEFIEAMMEALQFFTLRVSSIYSTPRLPRPVWLTLTSSMTSQRLPWQGNQQTISWFVSDLARTVDQYNTKQKNFFMSGLITSVLTHHLGWVNTTIAGSNNGSVTYNPLWAQLGDLYGAVGTPTKVAKTVIVGEIHEIVSTIISILSYFIRCSNVDEVVSVPTDMTPQAFSEDNTSLSMSYVKSDLENSDYVLVSCTGAPQSVSCDANKESSEKTTKTMKDKFKDKFCRKDKNSQPIEVKNYSTETSSGSTLCRSRSSPGTAAKPQHLKINRQTSGGNTDAKPRVRTNSNDMFARPRGVQSRRTSQYEVSNLQSRICQSSSAVTISDLGASSSLDGSKLSHCEPTTAPSTDISSEKSCLKEVVGNPTSKIVKSPDTTFLAPPKPKMRTHKRVASEPFTIRKIDGSGSPGRFPVVRQTFVERIEPKVINVGLVQRSQPVRAMQSPVSSPLLPRSKSSAGKNGPILGFKTNEKQSKMRLKHKSGSSLRDLAENCAPQNKLGGSTQNLMRKTVNSPSDVNLQRSSQGHEINVQRSPQGSKTKDQTLSQGHEVEDQVSSQGHKVKDQDSSQGHEVKDQVSSQGHEVNVQRSLSNVSTDGLHRSSSSNSGKVKLTNRRHRLTDSSSNSNEKVSHLPPLQRIPSISLEHDDFNEYFPEEGEKSEFIFFSTDSDKIASCMTKTQSTGTNSTDSKTEPISTQAPTTTETIVTESVNVKAENHSSMTRRAPPPLPTVGPVHRSTSEEVKKVIKSPNSGPKSAPPLPAAPPVHRGPLYPNLNPPNVTPLPKYSLYPNLNEKSEPKTGSKATNLYPNLEKPPDYDSVVPERSLYPKLPEPVTHNPYSVTRAIAQLPIPEHLPQAIESPTTPTTETFSAHEKLPLRTVEFTQNAETEKEHQDADDKQGKLLFGQLLADYSPEYLWGFALHGTKPQASLDSNIRHELRHSVSRPVLDEPVAEAVTIVADTDKWTVEVLSSHRLHSDKIALTALKSKLVTEILEKIKKLYQMNVPPAFCLKQLEQSLGELVLKSRMLAGYVKGNARVTMPQLSAVLGIESSDLPLLMAIACCHSPEVAAKLLVSN